MTFFGQLFGSGGFSIIAILFTLLSLGNFVQAVRLGANIRRRWADFTRNPLQRWHKQASESAAFLIMVPPGVLLHELAHAVFVWVYGGQVVDVGYGFYWGYVLPQGVFTATEDWVISISGTFASMLYAVFFWAIMRRHSAEAVRYLALRGLRFHFQYALIYYPIFTAVTFIGDWRVIYNFNETPLLSSVALAMHAGTLGFFWWSDRRGWYTMSAFSSETDRQKFNALAQQIAQGTVDEKAQLAYVRELLRQGEPDAAIRAAKTLAQQLPQSANAQQMLAGF